MESNTQKVLVIGEHLTGRRPPYLRIVDGVESAEQLANDSPRIKRAITANGDATYGFEFYVDDGTMLLAAVDADGAVHLERAKAVGPLAVLVRAGAALGETGERLRDGTYDLVREDFTALVDLGTSAQRGEQLTEPEEFVDELGRRLGELIERLQVKLDEHEHHHHDQTSGEAIGSVSHYCEPFCPVFDLGCCHG